MENHEIKNCASYCFDDKIKFKDFDSDNVCILGSLKQMDLLEPNIELGIWYIELGIWYYLEVKNMVLSSTGLDIL